MNKKLILIGAILLLGGIYSCSEDALKNEGDLLPLDTDANADTKLPNDMWGWVVTYPGEVAVIRERLENKSVVIKGYDVLKSALNVESKPKYWQSSGLYIAPAEKVEIVIPDGGGNLYYHIGVADIELYTTPFKRFYNVVKKADEQLKPGSHMLDHNFGGHLYFYYEGTPNMSDITVTVNGAVKSPDYILGQSDLQTWTNEVWDTLNPMIWGELIGKNIAIALPIEELRKIADPEPLLKEYDKIIDELGELWGGDFDKIDGVPLWRVYADIQLPKNAETFHGYPIGLDMSKGDILKKLINIRLFDSSDAKLIINALGKNYLTPWYASDVLYPIIPEISTYYSYNKQGKWPLDVRNEVMNLTENPISSFTNFSTFSSLDDVFKLRMLIQLAQQYGWGLYAYINKELNKEFPTPLSDSKDKIEMSQQIKNDLFAIAVSEYTNENLTEFFSAWRFTLTSYSKNYMKKYDNSPNSTVWTTFDGAIPEIDKGLTPYVHVNGRVDPMLIRDTVYDPTEWSAYASSSAGVNNNAYKLLDGNSTSNWENNWRKKPDQMYPHHVRFNFDKEAVASHELTFNYVVIMQRTGVTAGSQEPKEFKLKILVGKDWISVDDDHLFFLSNEDGEQIFYLNNEYTTRGVMLELLSSHAHKDGDRKLKGDCKLSEFRVGLIKEEV